MDLKEIMALSGKSGLFKVISKAKNGLIVESLLDKKRMPVYASDKISNLEEISIYTDDKEVPLKEVFKKIFDKESGGSGIDPKSDDSKLKEYFGQVLSNYDRERVYASDIKKVLHWYRILLDNQLLTFEEETVEEVKNEESQEENNPPAAPEV